MNKIILFILTLAFFFFVCNCVFAEVIMLKNGEIIKGNIIEENDEMIKVDTGIEIPVTYYNDEIQEIAADEVIDAMSEESDMDNEGKEVIEENEMNDEIDVQEDLNEEELSDGIEDDSEEDYEEEDADNAEEMEASEDEEEQEVEDNKENEDNQEVKEIHSTPSINMNNTGRNVSTLSSMSEAILSNNPNAMGKISVQMKGMALQQLGGHSKVIKKTSEGTETP